MKNESNYYPIGAIFEDGEKILQVVELENGCDGCYYKKISCTWLGNPRCEPEHRPDNKSIIYKETRLQQKQDALESRIASLEAQINEQNKKIDIVLSQLAESIKTH